jgi:hypothetical protein
MKWRLSPVLDDPRSIATHSLVTAFIDSWKPEVGE